jgi:hypothetical protein
MFADIGTTKVSSNRGRSKPRCLKTKTKPLFPVRRSGAGTKARKRMLETEIVK